MTKHAKPVTTEEPAHERLYTLAEAKQAMAERDCEFYGHDYEHLVAADGSLMEVTCVRCGGTWKVTG